MKENASPSAAPLVRVLLNNSMQGKNNTYEDSYVTVPYQLVTLKQFKDQRKQLPWHTEQMLAESQDFPCESNVATVRVSNS